MAGKSSKSIQPREEEKIWEGHVCGECAKCEPIYKHHTLTVKDRKPTLGKCPEVKNRCVLLSEIACRYFAKGGLSINSVKNNK